MKQILKSIPEEIRELFWIKIFVTFSYAVLYSSLALYITNNVGLSSHYATGIVGVFVSLNFLLHFFGGYAGGKLVSNRVLLMFGMVWELLGILIIQNHLLVGLGVFLTGSGLYATAINAIMIQRYAPEDNKREIASFWIYSGMNLGFFFGHTISGYFHMQGDYNSLFITAISACGLSTLLIGMNWSKFADRTTELCSISSGEAKNRLLTAGLITPILTALVIASLYYHEQTSQGVMLLGVVIFSSALLIAFRQPNKEDRNKLYAFLIMVLAALTFWALFFIGPMGMTLFIKQYVHKDLFGIQIPPQWFNNINTFIIVVGGPMLAVWFKKKRESGTDLSYPLLFSIALTLIGSAFVLMKLGVMLTPKGHLVPMIWVVLNNILLTLGELFLSPVGVAMVGKLAPHGKQGVLLGMWSMVSGIASIISKSLSQMMVLPDPGHQSLSGIDSYASVFNEIGWCAIIGGALLFLITPYVKKLMGDQQKQNERNARLNVA